MHRFFVGALAGALVLSSGAAVDAAAGAPVAGFGAGGTLTPGLLDETLEITVDPQGRVVAAGLHQGKVAIARYLTTGAPDPSFSGDGIALSTVDAVDDQGQTSLRSSVADVRVLGDGSVMAIGESRSSTTDPFSNSLFAVKVTATGEPASGFGTAGASTEFLGFTSFRPNGTIAPDGSAVMAQSASGTGYAMTVSTAGSFSMINLVRDNAAVAPTCAPQNTQNNVAGAATVSASAYVVVTTVPTPGCTPDTHVFVTKVALPGNTALWSKAFPLPEDALGLQSSVALVGDDVLVATVEGTTTAIRRYASADGAPVTSWGTGGKATVATGFGRIGAMAGQVGGRVVIVTDPDGSRTTVSVDQLLDNGADDPGFNRIDVGTGGGTIRATGVATGPDGRITFSYQSQNSSILRQYEGVTPDAVPLDPGRLLDTRPGFSTVDGLFAGIGRAAAGSVTKIAVAGRGGIPANASAAFLNLTLVSPSAPGYATIYPCTPTVPTASNVNYSANAVVPNSVAAVLDANGDVCVFTLAASDIIIDAAGYVPAGSAIGSINPARLLETRPGERTVDGVSQGIGRAAAGSVTKVRVAGRAGIPTNATAAVVNLTLVAPSAAGYATIYPCDPTPPNASNVNYAAGAFVANSVTAKLDANGDVCVFTLAAADILVDASAYVRASNDIGTLTPARLLDTRPGETTVDNQSAGIGRAAAGSLTKVRVAGRAGVPADATAAIVNLTAVFPAGVGYLSIYPCGPTPNTSNVNYAANSVVANGVTAKLDANGDVCIYTLAATDILLDVNGYLS